MALFDGTNILKAQEKRLLMKKILCLLLMTSLHGYAQDIDVAQERKGYWSTSLGYTYDFFVDGFVYVKEVQSVADSLSFNEDLNLTHWHNAAVEIRRTFKNEDRKSV